MGQQIEPEAGFEYAVSVLGDLIVYEAGVRMFDHYGLRSAEDTVITDLRSAHILGFDIAVNTPYAEGFGMLSPGEPFSGHDKSTNADFFTKRTLVKRLTDASEAPLTANFDPGNCVDWPDLAVLAQDWLAKPAPCSR